MEQIYSFISNRLDNIASCVKWVILFPICFVLMITRHIKQISKDIKAFKSLSLYSPITYYDKWYCENCHGVSLKTFFKNSYRTPNDYLIDVIPSDWCDKVEMIKRILFAMIIDFVEKEKCFETVDYSWDEEHIKLAKEIKRLYRYAKASDEQKEEAVRFLYKMFPDEFIKKMNYDKILKHTYGDKYTQLMLDYIPEDYIEYILDEIVIQRIVKLRLSLWT